MSNPLTFTKLAERPNIEANRGNRGRGLTPLSEAILDTIHGGAVQIDRVGMTEAQMRGRRTQFSSLARRHGYSLRSRTDDKNLYLWVEKLAPAVAADLAADGEIVDPAKAEAAEQDALAKA